MPMMPPPPPGEPPIEFLVDENNLKNVKNREGQENRRVAKWILRTARPYLPAIAGLVTLSVLGSLLGIAFALVSQQTINSAVDGNIYMLTAFAILLAIIGVSQILLRAVNEYCSERVSAKVENGYRGRLFDYILDRDYRQISSYHSGDLMNRVTDDVNIIVSGVTTFLPSIAEIIANLICAGGVLLLMDWRFSVIYVAATIVIIVVNRIWRKAIKQLSKEVRERDGLVRSYYQEAINSLLVLRVFVTEKHAKDTSARLLRDFYTKRLERNKVRIKSNATVGLSMSFGHLFALIWCSFQLVFGNMSYGTLVAIMQLTGQVQMPFLSVSNLSTRYYALIASGERLMAIEELDPELTDDERTELERGYDVRDLYATLDRITLKDVSFGYGGESVLQGVNASIDRGDTVAIMGQSGCGKSTMFKLILGVFRDCAGELKAEGTNDDGTYWERALGPQTRRLFAYVPQGNFLISGKLRDNIAFADREISDEEIWDACRIACADEFLHRLPKGLDTVIGERGSGLSEGQTQRVAVARALLSGAPILLLDEATSALDDETEARMLKNIQALENRTCLIVTHRKAALEICNKTLVLQDGAFRYEEPQSTAAIPGGPREPEEFERRDTMHSRHRC